MALFEGISGLNLTDLINLKIGDINESSLTAKLSSGKTIPISQQFIDICKAADIQEYQVTTDGKKYKLESSNTIYKHREKIVMNSQCAIQHLLRRLPIDDYDLTAKSIENSGLINMINDLSKENGLTAKEVLYNEDLFKRICDKYSFNLNARKRFLLEYSDFLD